MPAADELYLLCQQSKDICDNTITQWEDHFQWLQEVVLLAKQSRGEAIIPKTPARKRRVKKNVPNLENQPPDIDLSKRKSSRAAAKVAVEKNENFVQLDMNVKLRRPSTPHQQQEDTVSLVDVPDTIEMTDDSSTKPKEASIFPKDKSVSCYKTEDLGEIPTMNSCKESADESLPNSSEEVVMECVKTNIKNELIEELKKEEDIAPVILTVIERFTEKSSTQLQKETDDFEMPPPTITMLKEENNINPHPEECLENKSRPSRSTRTKKRIADEQMKEELPTRTTRTKKRKMAEEEKQLSSDERLDKEHLCLRITGSESDDASDNCSKQKTLPKPQNKIEPSPSKLAPVEQPKRMTRSKVRKIASTNISPAKPNTPKIKTNSLMLASKFSGSPASRSPLLKKNICKSSEVQEVSVEGIQVTSSSPKVVRHNINDNPKSPMASTLAKTKMYQTPSQASLSSLKILNIKSLYSSGSLQSSYSKKRRPLLNSSPQVIGSKIIGTPTEVDRTKNIRGSSFITRVQPSKPTREESEEKKLEDLKRKREREVETRRKKEELMRTKMEEQKKKNEELMRKVQEAVEAREAQEREKKEREERMKRKMVAAKKIEEMKQQTIRQQLEEEQRLKEEQKERDEQKKREEQRLIKEERMKKIEEKRAKLEEQRRLLAETREEKRMAKLKYEYEQEKRREAERILREKMEMENLKLKEEERKSSKKLDETFTASRPLDSTYIKPASGEGVNGKSEESKQSYDMTPLAKPQRKKSNNPNDYGIEDLRSDDSSDEDCAPKKEIPLWAKGTQLRKSLFDQEHYPSNIDDIFPPIVLLTNPNLIHIFPKQKTRFTKRTSSAVWNTPPYKVFTAII